MSHVKTSYVCLPCRASYKQPYGPERERRCPRCAGVMFYAGSAFQPPRRRDRQAWRALSVVLNAGIAFPRSCCGGPGWRPRSLSEVKERTTYARRTGEPLARALLRREI
ncbi:deoxyxylulose-5-phosphate synthase [Streptomyces sp. NPDC053493]|uniref:deoxyxylulose-5-phosphate synthase n=1 Tax=Streptomyces sp. NPDC053493 TaxID=3365705 RepID=UPI0037CEE8AD